MNLLKEGIETGVVVKTDRATKLVVDGLSKTYPIYKVKINHLFFNDRNDRISTWISEYKAKNGIGKINKDNREEYNDLIQSFITQSNPDKLKKTQMNIELVGQQKYGVVLKDGRIIDGNRRFSCLRNIAKKKPEFQYFETVILDGDYQHNEKQIKMLELQIQIGEEARVDYNPIDRLVGVYHDLIKNKLLTVEEYARSANMRSNEVKKYMELSKLMAEFLEIINAKEKFYIARDLELDGPLNELLGVLNKLKDEDQKQAVKCMIFANWVQKPHGDMTRFTRKFKNIVEEDKIDEIVELEWDVTEEIIEELSEVDDVNADVIAKIRTNEKRKHDMANSMELIDAKVKSKKTRNEPSNSADKVIVLLSGIDKGVIQKLDENQKSELLDKLEMIENMVLEFKEIIE